MRVLFRNHSRRDLLLALLLSLADLVYVKLTQDRITVNWGLGWDGDMYVTMAGGKLSDVGYPFGGRIALPLLARHFVFSDLVRNFEALNLFFGFVFSFLAFLTIASITPTLSLATKITSWCLLSATQLSPLVQSAWYPVQTDAAANCLLMLLVYAVVSGIEAPILYFLVFTCGTLVRENFPVFAGILLIDLRLHRPRSPFGNWLRGELVANRSALFKMAAAVAGSVLALAVMLHVATYNVLAENRTAYLIYLGRQRLGAVAAALINVYGCAGLFYLLWRTLPARAQLTINPFRARWGLYLAATLLFVALDVGAGTNVERYLFSGLPLIVVYLTPCIDALVKARHYAAFAFGFVFMLLFQRSFCPIEKSGIAGCDLLSIVRGDSTFLGHWVQICSSEDAVRLIVAYVVVCALALVVGLQGRMDPIKRPR